MHPIYLLLKQYWGIKLGSSAKIINNPTCSPQRAKTNTVNTHGVRGPKPQPQPSAHSWKPTYNFQHPRSRVVPWQPQGAGSRTTTNTRVRGPSSPAMEWPRTVHTVGSPHLQLPGRNCCFPFAAGRTHRPETRAREGRPRIHRKRRVRAGLRSFTRCSGSAVL